MIGTILAGLSAVGLICISYPVPENTISIPLKLNEVTQGELLLTTPSWIKMGDQSEVSLQVSYDPDVKMEEAPQKLGLISQLEIGFVEVSPQGQGHVSVSQGNTIILIWQLKPLVEADFSGMVWLFEQQTDGKKQLILGKSIKFQSRKFLGLSYKTARIISFCGIVIGIILFIPFIWDKIIKKRIISTSEH